MEVITKENTDRCFPVCNRKRESSLAQSVERLTVNQDVTGSSPVGGAKKNLGRGTSRPSFFVQ